MTSSYIIKDTAKVAKTSVHNVSHVPSNNFESCCPFRRQNSVNLFKGGTVSTTALGARSEFLANLVVDVVPP